MFSKIDRTLAESFDDSNALHGHAASRGVTHYDLDVSEWKGIIQAQGIDEIGAVSETLVELTTTCAPRPSTSLNWDWEIWC